jgi:hypothetical protein
VYYGYSQGLSGLWELFLYDSRPFATIVYYIGFAILGFKALHWHIFALMLRFLTIVFTWLYLQDIWPKHKREITWVAMLFAIYPLFKQHSLSVAYSLHWTGYLLFSISIWAMVQSVRKPHRFWPFTVLSVVTNISHLVLLEYFVGVELIRPIIIWLLVSEEERPINKRIQKSVKLWLPYFLVLIAFVIYRIYFIPRPEPGFERNDPTVIFDLLKSPVTTTIQLIKAALQDTTAILYSVWHNVINPGIFEITQPANIIAISIAILTGCALVIYLNNLRFENGDSSEPDKNWYRSALLVGILLTVLGPVPAWVTDQHITTDNPLWSDRYGLPSMVGASLVVVAIMEALISNKKYRMIILCILIGFSINWHILNTNDYRWSWIKQSRFYSQLYWRAPYIEPNTAFLSDGEVLNHMTEVSTSFALSTLYPKFEASRDVNYWFFNVSRRFKDTLEVLINGRPLKYSRFFSEFSGYSHDSLVILYEPKISPCLWVLRPEDQEIPVLPEITREIVMISNLDRIKIGSPYERPIPPQIFGSDPELGWCYYFQKGDLARQYQDWDQVVALWNGAAENGFSPGNGVEYIPFIEGFAHAGDWETAEEMTYKANDLTKMMSPILCSTWQRIEEETQPSETRDATLASLYNMLVCP